MAWVEDKIAEHKLISKSLQPLWNTLRDSIGEAVTEFQLNVHDSGVSCNGCKTRGRYCMRILRGEKSIEVFLDLSDRTVKLAILDGDGVPVSGYRPNGTGSALEFFSIAENLPPASISAEEVSRAALEKFLFSPFPIAIITQQVP